MRYYMTGNDDVVDMDEVSKEELETTTLEEETDKMPDASIENEQEVEEVEGEETADDE